MLFPIVVSIPIITGTVVVILLVMIVVSRFQGKNLETTPLLICGVTMLVAGCASLFVTRWARCDERFSSLSGLIGVTTIMIVPLVVVVITHLFAEITVARLVFAYFVVYYLIYLPVGTWLILPPKLSQDKCKAEDDLSQQDE